MHLDDWRTATPGEIAACYASERTRWRSTLHWDTTRTWQTVEAARTSGALPGFVLRDEAGAIRAWSFHLLHRGELQLGSMVAYSQRATECLVKAIAESPEARSATRWMAFGWFDAPGLVNLLRIHGVRSERHRYLHRDLFQDPEAGWRPPDAWRQTWKSVGTCVASELRSWRPEDEVRLASLLSSAYGGPDSARPFAAGSTIEEWVEYAANVVHGAACGIFDPELSRVALRGQELAGAAVITRLLPTTAHLAQLAVRSDTQGCGLGEHLLVAALDAAGRAGCECATLLVRESNFAAGRLYARLGFAESARFLSASSALSCRLSAAS